MHYLYILALSFLTSTFFYYQSGTNWNYIDALFMATSSATSTGLITIDMSKLTTWQLLVAYAASFMGSHVMISIIVLYVRRHYFSKRFEDILAFNRAQQIRETNRRKFEKNVQEIEKQRRKSISSMDKRRRQPLRKRLSFLSVKSSATEMNDEENSESTVPTHGPRKKSRFSAQRPLSMNFHHFDLLSPFKKNHHHENGTGPPTSNIRAVGPEMTEVSIDPNNGTDTHTVHPTVRTSESGNNRHLHTLTDESDISYQDDSFPRDNSNSPILHSFQQDNNSESNDVHTFSLVYQGESENMNDNNNVRYLANSTENTLSNSPSHNYNSNHNNSASNDDNSNNQLEEHSENTVQEDTVTHTSHTTHDDHNNASSSNQGIAFAENIERQREIARRRLEQDRRFDDILQRIAGNEDLQSNNNYSADQDMEIDTESDDEEMIRIMREPIHKRDLTKKQRYRLGGAEYRAIVFLTRLVPMYYLVCAVGFGFVIRIYIAASTYAQDILRTTNSNGPVNEWFFSFFCSMSSFNNLGLIQVDASMVPFQSAPGLLLPIIFLVFAGNTAYAIFLRLIIWIFYKVTPKSHVMQRETYRYLLDHPRRCYTSLFPATHTKWLVIALIGITAVEFTTFVALNFWLPVLSGISWGARVLDGFFQSVANRSGK